MAAMERGQASVEYVAIVALVGLVLAAAVALTPGGIGAHIAWALRTALCRIGGGSCPGPFALRADLPPCPLSDDDREQGSSLTVAVVHVGSTHGLRIVRYSDHHVEVSFADESRTGLAVGVGAHIDVGPLRVAEEASTGVDWTVTAGRTWSFDDQAAADRFVARFGRRQQLVGGALHAVHEACFVCGWLGAGPAKLPPPSSVTSGAGTAVALDGRLAAGLELSGSAEHREVLGSRADRDGSHAVYLRQSDTGTAAATLGLRLGADIGRESAVEIDQDRHGRVTAIVLHGLARRALGASRAGGLLHRTRADGTVTETETTLSDPSAAAVRGALVLVRPRAPTGADAADLARLAADLRHHAIRHRRVFALHVTHGDAGGSVDAGVGAGADVEAGSSQLRLRSETVRVPRVRVLPRGDCRPAAGS
jgi:hypothetical protein